VNVSYKPAWVKYFALSIVVHILIIFLLAFLLRKPVLEVKFKEVKISLVSASQKEQVSVQSPASTSVSRPKVSKPITREEIDKAIFEIVAPKKSAYIPASEVSPVIQPQENVRENVAGSREFSDKGVSSSESKEFRVKEEGQGSVSKEVLKKAESGQGVQMNIPEVKSKEGGVISGSIRWVKGEPRKVIEWYSPEIPPGVVKSKTEVVLTFFIEPSGFVSRIEIEKTSGEPLVDEIVYKTMKRIRFSPSQVQTVATVSFTIIPQ
jgi:TonB family protein